ncbi:MAG: ShlB/FhaC/HecB family hemolysin secretion/activation protein [bacterium]|nr:ShlB/FhaC/HecB family hemolysin secretion/activation protein [bacterium]
MRAIVLALVGWIGCTFAPVFATALDLPQLDELAALRDREGVGTPIVRSIELTGPAPLLEVDHETVLEAYRGSPISTRRLASLRDELTASLIEAGFINSGARIPRQSLLDGRLRVELVGGRLDRVIVEGNRYFNRNYLEKRIHLLGNEPLNLHELERRLYWIADEPLVEKLHARLEPGLNPGDAVLRVEVTERQPYNLRLFVGNDTVHSIGSEHMRLYAGHNNLLGNRDTLEAYLGKTPGLSEWKLGYSVPINRFDTRLFASFRDSHSQIVHSDLDLDAISLESRSHTFTVGIEQPLRIGRRTELLFSVRGDLRRARSRVNGFGFFLNPGEDDQGRVRASVLRFVQTLSSRRTNRVFSARSTFSLGLDVLDASSGELGRGNATPDGTFISWLGQAYWVNRLPKRFGRSQIVVRADVQLAKDPMLAMERMAVGGQRTVRGYPENAIVRDNGAAGSLELRVPLTRQRATGWSLELAPFLDAGHAWNRASDRKGEWLASLGLGLRLGWREHLSMRFEWGARLLDVDSSTGGLQGHGFHIQAELRL